MALFGGSEASTKNEPHPQNIADLYGASAINIGKKGSVKGDLVLTDQGATREAIDLAHAAVAAAAGPGGALNSILLYGGGDPL